MSIDFNAKRTYTRLSIVLIEWRTINNNKFISEQCIPNIPTYYIDVVFKWKVIKCIVCHANNDNNYKAMDLIMIINKLMTVLYV